MRRIPLMPLTGIAGQPRTAALQSLFKARNTIWASTLFIAAMLLSSLNGFAQTTADYTMVRSTGTYASIESVPGAVTATGILYDDRQQTNIPIGFTFNFCGVDYTQLSASSNCWLSLANSAMHSLSPSPAGVISAGFLMVLQRDQFVGSGSAFFVTTGTSPNRVFTFEWKDWTYCCSVGAYQRMQVKLYEGSNNIEYHYGSHAMTLSDQAIGIANSSSDYQVLETTSGSTTTTTAWSSPIGYVAKPDDGTVLTWSTSTGCVLPTPVNGPATVCEGSTVSLSHAMGSGTWSSADPSVASIGTYSGYLTGVSAGTVTITYTQYTGCTRTRVETVNMTPATVTVTGAAAICIGNTLSYNTVSTGGVWVSSHPSVASIDSFSGIATGVSGGNATISYRMPSGCSSTLATTVNQLPLTITGTAFVCEGGTSTLSSATTGGTWTSADAGTASIAPTTGVATGVAAGMTTISYTLSTGCARTREVTVNTVPPTISGSATLCVGSTSALTNATTGGTWVSSNTSRATVGGTTGIVTGVSAGNANITYTVAGGGCYTVQQVTINAVPTAITGTLNACIGSTSTLGHATSGGTWTSSNTLIATVDAATGVVTGVMAGVAGITYTVTPGCFKTATFTVRALPTAITTSGMVCEGATLGLSSTPTGGTWTSGTPANATIMTGTGVLTGLVEGTTLVSYIASPGCMTTREITINAIPTAITGNTAVCVGSTTALTGAPAGGTWVSSNTAKATVLMGTGVVSGVAAGTATMTYTLASGCRRTAMVTVGTLPSAISGTLTLCAGSTTTLASTPAGGTWISVNTDAATVGTGAGLVTGVATGNSVISYTYNGCVRSATVTVNAALPSIGGDPIVCVGNATALTNATTPGTWSSSLTTKATVNVSTGVVTGVAAGNSTITYKTSPTCYTTVQATVNGTVAAITGTNGVCAGMTTELSTMATGGTWSSNNTAKATIDAMTGIVTGVAAGSATISYIQSTGCYKTITVVVYATPAAIGGSATVCEGGTTTLTNVTGGGTWSSGSTIATIATPGSGVVTGASAGFGTITYRLSTGCISTREVTVNITPSISGSTPICAGTTTEFSTSAAGGTWISSTPSVATVGSSSGMVTGLIGGGTTLTYTLSTGCRKTMAVAVNPQPAAITGTATVNAGATTSLSSTTTGGTWSSSDMEIATVGTSGMVTGVAGGNSTITYQLTSTGCYRTRTVTVNAILVDKPAITEAATEAIFNVYPNPTTGTFTLSSDVNGVFTVFTLDGKQVEQYNVTNTATTLSLPRNLAAGVYMCRFAGDNGSNKIVRIVYQP